MQIEMPDGAEAVLFKHEDETPAGPIGPVWFVIDGSPVNAYQSEVLGEPNPGWMHLTEAARMAEHFGLRLDET